jgi:KEOPS complex subunit Cgi121
MEMITAAGAKGQIKDLDTILEKVKRFSKEKGVDIQLFNVNMVFGKVHLISSAEHALRAFKNKRNRSDSLPMEMLLYASGERQIIHAIKKMGISEKNEEFGIVMIGHCELKELLDLLGWEQDDSVLKGDINNLSSFNISKAELKTVDEKKVCDLVLERVAMLDVKK